MTDIKVTNEKGVDLDSLSGIALTKYASKIQYEPTSDPNVFLVEFTISVSPSIEVVIKRELTRGLLKRYLPYQEVIFSSRQFTPTEL